jgi:hypothetical protein
MRQPRQRNGQKFIERTGTSLAHLRPPTTLPHASSRPLPGIMLRWWHGSGQSASSSVRCATPSRGSHRTDASGERRGRGENRFAPEPRTATIPAPSQDTENGKQNHAQRDVLGGTGIRLADSIQRSEGPNPWFPLASFRCLGLLCAFRVPPTLRSDGQPTISKA